MNHLLFLAAPELIVIALVFLLLFGGKKIPELMKGLGKGVKSFKDGLSDVENEIKDVGKDVGKDIGKDIKYDIKDLFKKK
jgi:sec-independent protein translocase protein TatA